MAKGIRSKSKRKFRTLKRGKFEPVRNEQRDASEAMLKDVLNGTVKPSDCTAPMDKWLNTYSNNTEKVHDAPENKNHIDARCAEDIIDMNKKKQLCSFTAIQSMPNFKPRALPKGKTKLETAALILKQAEKYAEQDAEECDYPFGKPSMTRHRRHRLKRQEARDRKRKNRKGRSANSMQM